MPHYLLIHVNVAMGVFMCECTEGVHLSFCLRMLEQGSVLNDALYLIWFVHKPLLQVDFVQVLEVFLAFQSVGLCRSLSEHCLYQALEFFPYEATAPLHECSTTRFAMLELLFEL